MAAIAGVMEVVACVVRKASRARSFDACSVWTGIPLAIAGAAWWLATPELPFWAQILVTLALVTPLGPLLYRIAYQPLAEASVLVLLIVSVAVHFAPHRARTVVLRRRRLAHDRPSPGPRSTSPESPSACKACWSSHEPRC
jgi:hypothetical protein